MAISLRFLRVVLVLAIVLAAPAHDRKISEKTARRLVREALAAMRQQVPPSQITRGTSHWSPELYAFDAVLGQTDGRPALTWGFAVNPWNGDVWNVMECSRVTSPAIEREQEAIWKRSGLPADAREPLRHKHPGECPQIR
jgi:hypothetical protein